MKKKPFNQTKKGGEDSLFKPIFSLFDPCYSLGMECFNALGLLISGGILMVALVSLVIAAILFYARFFGGELKNIKELLSNHVSPTQTKGFLS